MEFKHFNEQLLESIVNNNFIGITIIDNNGNIIFRNKICEELSGVKNSDILGKHFSLIPGKGELLNVLKTRIPMIGTLYNTKMGKKAVINRFPLYGNDEKIIGAITTVTFKDTDEMEDILRKYHIAQYKVEHYEQELRNLRSAKYSLDNIIGKSDNIISLKKLIAKCSIIDSPILITGETGTGKELCAHSIHIASERRNGPFIKLNCASIPKDLFESEFFGYEPGAFTNASKVGKIGKFELANHGTIFLDEISCLPFEMQSKLLRVLQDKEIEKIGGNKVIKSNFRLITATNKPLGLLMQQNKFREDLYYRIKVFNVDIPPLRDRKEDIPLLCENFIESLNEEYGLQIEGIDRAVMEIFFEWQWPGNVRELRNVLERAVHLTETRTIEVKDLPDYLIASKNIINSKNTQLKNILREAKRGFEKNLLESALNKLNWNISKVSSQLGISRPLLYALIKKYNLKKDHSTNHLQKPSHLP